MLLKERHKEGYWYTVPEVPAAPEYNRGGIANLPASLQASASRALDRYERERREYGKAAKQLAAIEKAIRDRDGAAAWRILIARRDHEYERIHLVDCEAIK
jgi:hypothetical protein